MKKQEMISSYADVQDRQAIAKLLWRLFDGVSALALLLVIALGVLWVRSYWCCDLADYISVYRANVGSFVCRITSNRGALSLTYIDGPDVGFFPTGFSVKTQTAVKLPRSFTYEHGRSSVSGAVSWNVVLPHWLPMLMATVPPGLWLVRERKRRRRRNEGCCPTCGYDMRATPDRCPECGGVPEKPVAA